MDIEYEHLADEHVSKSQSVDVSEVYFDEVDVYVNGINIHFGHWYGSEAEETVIAIPGLTANHRCWGTIAQSLVRAGINVIALDLRGRGLSSKPRSGYGIDVHVEDIRAVIDELQIKKPVFMGHSLGAMVGLAFAAKYPEYLSKLILLDAGAMLPLTQLVKALSALRPSLSRLGVVFRTREQYLDIMRSSSIITVWNDVIEDHILYELEEVQGGWRCNVPAYVVDGEFQAFGGGLDMFTVIRNTLTNPVGQLMKARPGKYFPYAKIPAPTLAIRAGDANMSSDDSFLTEEGLREMEEKMPACKGISVPNTNHYTVVFAESQYRDTEIINFIKQPFAEYAHAHHEDESIA